MYALSLSLSLYIYIYNLKLIDLISAFFNLMGKVNGKLHDTTYIAK